MAFKILKDFFTEYNKSPKKLRIIDAFLIWALLTGVIQFIYVCLVGTFPFNSFLAGFISTIGTFVFLGLIFLLLSLK
jgi:oligosaccharyltransferase complex subunit epsilon